MTVPPASSSNSTDNNPPVDADQPIQREGGGGDVGGVGPPGTSKVTATTTATDKKDPTVGAADVVVPESSPQDDRSYRVFTTRTGLTTLLVSDPTTDKASAAVDVRVGHLSDPEEVAGLAHFLEHMLFMGTEKYPDENSYNAYLNQNGGSSNAFTDMESTNYYFDVNADHLAGALDRFAQFFISPLFTPSATEREMNAVDSEHAKNVQSDYWRLFQLSKTVCRPSHPFSKFGSGNLETLRDEPKSRGVDVRAELLAFHERYYSANVMRLVVLGRESLDELEEMVETCFADLVDKGLPVPLFPGEPFGPDQLRKRLRIVPVKEMRHLEICFPMREINSLYLCKPTRYLSHLIGHEGKGSILALLKEKGWANELSAGESRACSDWSSFSVSIELTDAGLEHVDDVVEIVLSYIALIRKEGAQEWIHDETATVAACQFRFLSKRNPIDYTCSLAGAMQLYDQEHILSGPYKIYSYDPDRIEECLSYLTPSNMIIMVMDRNYEGSTDLKERWYGTEYSIEDLDDALLTKWKNASIDSELTQGLLHFPKPNDLIASDFALIAETGAPKDEPRLLVDTKTCRLWYKPDNVFQMPKLNVMALLKTSVVSQSPETSVLSLLWVQILQEHATEFTYVASMASLHCSFSNARKGIEVHVSGYNHKLHLLLDKIVHAINELPRKLDEDLFARIKDKQEKQYQNFLFSQPYQHAMYAADLCSEPSKWSIQDKMEALSKMQLDDVVNFSKLLLSRFQLEALVHGNTSPDDAKTIAATILDGLKPNVPFCSNMPQLRVVQLEDGMEYVYRLAEFNEGNTNSSLEVLYQIGAVDIEQNAILAFLHHLIREPAFNELRSQEQLGYIVHTSIKTNGDNIKGMMFLIQSDSFDPTHVDARIEAFLDRFRSKVTGMTKEEFRANIDAVVEMFLEKNKNLGEESGKYWEVVTNGSYMFKKYQNIANEVKAMTVEKVLRFFDKYIAKDAPHRRKLSVQVYGKTHIEKMREPANEGITLLSDDEYISFRNERALFPLAMEVNVEGMKM